MTIRRNVAKHAEVAAATMAIVKMAEDGHIDKTPRQISDAVGLPQVKTLEIMEACGIACDKPHRRGIPRGAQWRLEALAKAVAEFMEAVDYPVPEIMTAIIKRRPNPNGQHDTDTST